jgi:hypothetical protein
VIDSRDLIPNGRREKRLMASIASVIFSRSSEVMVMSPSTQNILTPARLDVRSGGNRILTMAGNPLANISDIR